MSDGENHHHGRNEIIIVKRHGGGDHDGAHGGAWKIAYADFMTAMMAFFLVMWLVNAANEETKAAVATYFNPIKLADEKPTEKGLKKPVDHAEGEEKKEKSKQKEDNPTEGKSAADGDDQTSTSGDQTNYSEADFFENPYSVLAEIAQEVGQQANVSAKGDGGAADSGPATGADGGQAYRDPFDPDFWTKQVEVTTAGKPLPPGKSEEQAAESETTEIAKAEDMKPVPLASDQKPAKEAPTKEAKQTKETTGPAETRDGKATDGRAPEEKKAEARKDVEHQKEADKSAAGIEQQKKEAEQLQAEIAQQIGGVAGKLAEGLTVTAAEGGLLVSISDQNDDSMFNIGSAVPRQEMVLAMEKIGTILKERGGAVAVRGHTDGRQYKGGQNENWRLSMDRAQSAYYMLVRGGLDETRVSQVSGFADRRLKLPADPFNAANRRIEILVQAE
ncbi:MULTISPECIES: MotB family protein [unclassified Rhizobium]|uniref:MotB family protein n=1 Tax=unclassified Rhizobium TaxID=2613769 RepID=UPI001C82C836|nr:MULTISPECIES: MotB family protein [unclassified Rhizobium]MBX5214526.1 MotB family protein [Rhizobium sp. NLR9a]MBX5231681.1 MotB family protein [Rhizobium sp. NLR4a]MBX5243941.1 MotB family protein [Rhizobium sp. NLR3b]MBX5269812.1 MotB family protein [Rhizobium sp. NLR17b]MBX5275801.1 MotB family protein [Rhizobium sp. NLR13a]